MPVAIQNGKMSIASTMDVAAKARSLDAAGVVHGKAWRGIDDSKSISPKEMQALVENDTFVKYLINRPVNPTVHQRF